MATSPMHREQRLATQTTLPLGNTWQGPEMCWAVTHQGGDYWHLVGGSQVRWLVAPPQSQRAVPRHQHCELGKPWFREVGGVYAVGP